MDKAISTSSPNVFSRRWAAGLSVGLSVLTLLDAARTATLAEDPTTPECLAAYEQSITLRDQHALNAARAQLLICASTTCPEEVRSECSRRVEEVNAQVPTLVFEVRDHNGNDLSEVSVTMDGVLLAPRLDGTAFSIDPGEHAFVFNAEGTVTVTKRFVIRDSEKGRREKVVLEPEPAPALAATPAPLPAPPVQAPPPAQPQASNDDLRIAGVIAGATAVAALGVALYEDISAHSQYAASKRAAQSGDASERAKTHGLYTDAKQAQTIAIVIASVGAVALGASAYCLLAGGSDVERDHTSEGRAVLAPWVAPTSGGVFYTRAF
jgi:hypothetical protein